MRFTGAAALSNTSNIHSPTSPSTPPAADSDGKQPLEMGAPVERENVPTAVLHADARADPADLEYGRLLAAKIAGPEGVISPAVWQEIGRRFTSPEYADSCRMEDRKNVIWAKVAQLVDGVEDELPPDRGYAMTRRDHAYAKEFCRAMTEWLTSAGFSHEVDQISSNHKERFGSFDRAGARQASALLHALHLLKTINDQTLELGFDPLPRVRPVDAGVETKSEAPLPRLTDAPAGASKTLPRVLALLNEFVGKDARGEIDWAEEAFADRRAALRATNPLATEREIDTYCRAQAAEVWLSAFESQFLEGGDNPELARHDRYMILRTLEASVLEVMKTIDAQMRWRKAVGAARPPEPLDPPPAELLSGKLASKASTVAREQDANFARSFARKLAAELSGGAYGARVAYCAGLPGAPSRQRVRELVLEATAVKLANGTVQPEYLRATTAGEKAYIANSFCRAMNRAAPPVHDASETADDVADEAVEAGEAGAGAGVADLRERDAELASVFCSEMRARLRKLQFTDRVAYTVQVSPRPRQGAQENAAIALAFEVVDMMRNTHP
ncbi:hypothetical protein [Ramlibacter albus]|uniref:Uncharacterized protein n=1 Tax=Ramlibacter albus TaxID=2079448 RepID=A0A923M9J0_9BURK|nr:hypothetical protein [Ramlibacter albus]MBC5766782.1 hypothetical protein [Ramlibacter albus]